jgi:hypothetical protein
MGGSIKRWRGHPETHGCDKGSVHLDFAHSPYPEHLWVARVSLNGYRYDKGFQRKVLDGVSNGL